MNPSYYSATVGENVTIECRSTSNKTAIWYKQNASAEIPTLITNSADGKVLIGLEKKFRVEETANGHSRLTILNFQPSDEGKFMCKESYMDDNIATSVVTMAGGRTWQITSWLTALKL